MPKSSSTPLRTASSRTPLRPIPPRRPRRFDVDDAAQALAGVVWWSDPERDGRRCGVTVVSLGGYPVGVHVEVGPADPVRQRAAAAQGWLYLVVDHHSTAQTVIDAAAAARRGIADQLRAG